METKLIFDIEADELEIFLEEANEHVQATETGILRLEHDADADLLNAIFRAAHTLKALAGTIGHHRLAELTHMMETLFDAMRSDKFVLAQQVIDDLLAAVDIMKVLLAEVTSGESSGVEVTDIIARLNEALAAADQSVMLKDKQNVTAKPALAPEQIARAERCQAAKQTLLEIKVNVASGIFAPAGRLSQAVMALLEVGEFIAQQPTLADLANGQHDGYVWAILATPAKIETIRELLASVPDLGGVEIEAYQLEVAPAAPTPAGGGNLAAGSGGHVGDKTIRISVERLDALMNLVGELVTTRNRLVQLESKGCDQSRRNGVESELTEAISRLSRIVDQTQEEIMAARMVPIAALFEKFPRIVRDVARITGKQINFVIEGEATELDRSLIEFISDPLVHLLRNAVDHGIESPQQRLAAGKPATGTVRLAAAHMEGQIVITIEDDGGGIDPERIRRAGLSRGLITEAEASQLDDEAAIDLIFRPNLSTATQITKVSGRGVGMDVVRANVERLSGSVVVESALGQGTTFRVTLPLTLAIIQAMLVSVGNNAYAVPLSSIIESLYLSAQTINTVKGRPTIQWRNTVLPLLNLREFFKIPLSGSVTGGSEAKTDAKPAVITVNSGKLKAGLVVDKIIDKQDIVVKSLSSIIGETPGLSGGAILGNGEIALVIDVTNLINAAVRVKKQVV